MTTSGTEDGSSDDLGSEVTAHPDSVAHARSLLQDFLAAQPRPVGEQAAIDLLLIVSELVTNAIRHGGGVTSLRLAARPGLIDVEVGDHSDEMPVMRDPARGWGPGGYGWPLVCRLATEVDLTPAAGGGKSIRATLAH
ncbi:ATP-binding protein [Streptomyces meridianus]|uniref:ATP-binding protein n=1 Tax=Streptomyces meridianus TaxID=2938945 RepID=A0ABT0X544_9ACTN|nr:ATP-binding protein [Streptomyces meridianus]MCM2576767.1 ATP-binding protein [Streptomyces meridianus]